MYAVTLIRPIVRDGYRVKTWTMTWIDTATGKRKKKTTHTANKALARVIANQQHEKLVRQAHGLLDPFEEYLTIPIDRHVDDYERILTAKKRNGDYVQQNISRLNRLAEECKWRTIADISITNLELVLGRLTDARSRKLLSTSARNGYLVSAKSFCSWLVKAKRMAANPLIGAEKLNTDKDRRRIRRPLSAAAEFGRLVVAAKMGPTIEGMTGRERAMAYILAAYTGFRLRGIRYLRVRDFNFTIQTVTLPPEAAKNGKITAPTPLHPDIVEPLRKFVAGLEPNDRVLPRLTKDVSADGIKVDLTAADIPIVDDRGRVVDFHALRGTFCTWLKDTGTNLADNQKLMHHSDPSLTSNIYSDTSLEAARAAIMRLPPPPSLD